MWLLGKDYYRDEEALMRQLLRPGDNFVDVGSNIGHLSIVAKNQVKGGRVVAIEAHPQTAEYARKNFALNSVDIDLLNFGVGAQRGVMTLTNLYADDMNYIVEDRQGGDLVSVRTLDDLLASLDEIQLLKVDIEGYELMAFRGAVEVLKRARFVYFEVWSDLTEKYNYTPRELIGYLEGLDFKIYHVRSVNDYEPLFPDEDFSKSENLLAVSARGRSDPLLFSSGKLASAQPIAT